MRIIKANGPLPDIYGTDGANEGRHYTAIYQVEANKQTICYNLNGGTYPFSLKTEGKLYYFLSVLVRAEK
ncbi:MAG: hypothetical protein JST50_01485 [Bacteroidetes bacterium]|jgi:hypothetical protein|nr:hypothetical protein [Bacteroidota bacterium]